MATNTTIRLAPKLASALQRRVRAGDERRIATLAGTGTGTVYRAAAGATLRRPQHDAIVRVLLAEDAQKGTAPEETAEAVRDHAERTTLEKGSTDGDHPTDLAG